MEGAGGLGFFMLDGEGNIKYASNAKNICIPTSVGHDFTIYSYDADGSLHEVTKAGSGTEYVELSIAGKLRATLQNDQVIKLIVSGPINATDLTYMKQLINKENLQSIDLAQARTTSIPSATFQNIKKLVAMKLPQNVTSIGSTAFSGSGIMMIEIPDKVTSVGGDAFAYCNSLTTVIVGKAVKTMDQGVFYGSGNIKEAYVKPLTPPTLNGESSYLFSGKNRTIHVYASALDAYKAANWERFGTLVGDLTDEIIDGIETIEHSTLNIEHSDAIFDLMGRRVTTLLPGTIYIQNGKKFMMK
jgi:hypothetical protein